MSAVKSHKSLKLFGVGKVEINTVHTIDWLPSPGPQGPMGRGITDIWHIPVRQAMDGIETLVSAAELERANRFRTPASRAQYLTARAALRWLSAKYQRAAPDAFMYATGDNGKPSWMPPHNSLVFNSTHSGAHVFICFAASEVGIDVEEIKPGLRFDDVLQKCFSDPEKSAIRNATHPGLSFYQYWTRKEALLKASGRGLQDDPCHVPCMDGGHAYRKDWMVTSFVKENAVVSVACDPGSTILQFFELSM